MRFVRSILAAIAIGSLLASQAQAATYSPRIDGGTFTKAPYYNFTPNNLYVQTGGDDGGLCTSAAPCATLQRACEVAENSEFGGQWNVIYVGPGDFPGCEVSGAVRGAAGDNFSGAYLVVSGAGSSTHITDAGHLLSFVTSNHASVLLQNLKIVAASGVASVGVFAQSFSVVQIGTGVTFVGGGTQSAAMHVESGALIEAAPHPITFEGTYLHIHTAGVGGFIEYDPSPGGSLVCSSCNFQANFALVQYGAGMLVGTGWTFSGWGSPTGRPYAISANGVVANWTGSSLPGTGPGWIWNGGRMDPPPPVTSVTSTGLGTGGTASVVTGTASSGTIKLQAGTGASAQGTLTITMPEYVLAQVGGAATVPAACLADLQDGTTGTWLNFKSNIHTNGFGSISIVWYNNSALTNGQDYLIVYKCIS